MQHTEFDSCPLEADQGFRSLTNQLGGDNLASESTISTEPFKGFCDTVEEFRELEKEIGLAARWTVPYNPAFAPDWESRWKWEPEDGLGWPIHGTDCYVLFLSFIFWYI